MKGIMQVRALDTGCCQPGWHRPFQIL